MNNDELLRELDSFLDRYGIADSTFGIRAVGDSHLVERIRNRPAAIRRSTILKIRKYIARYELDNVA
tara:strand:+ start:289 stop:489 length:201 start_codon:yes stop_codon:yes gene_type:complete